MDTAFWLLKRIFSISLKEKLSILDFTFPLNEFPRTLAPFYLVGRFSRFIDSGITVR